MPSPMDKWKVQSEKALAEGVCHTAEEGKLMYTDIPVEKKLAATLFIVASLSEDVKDEIRKRQVEDPENWLAGHHFGLGMAIRNMLRKNGMGEAYFEIDNLDCIQHSLFEDAMWGVVRA